MSTFKKKFLLNGLASTIQSILRVAQQLLLVPFFISAWGAAYYGEWLTFTIIPTMIGLSDFGFGTAAANTFILKYAENDKQGAANIIKTGFRIVNYVVIGCISISVVLMLILDYFQIFEKSLIDSRDGVIAISFLMGARLLGFYNQLFQAYFRAARQAAFGINLMNIFIALNIIGGIVVLSLGFGIVIYSITLFVISIIFVLFLGYMANHTLAIKKEYTGIVLKEDVKLITQKGFGFMLSVLWQAVYFQGSTFVVRITLGPVAVTIFNTVRTFMRSISQVNGVVIASVIPELQYEIGAKNFMKARKIFRFSLVAVFCISILGMLFLYFVGPLFYELWTKKTLYPPVLMWNIFILGILLNGVWWLSGDVLIFANKPYDFTIPATISSLIAVILSYFLSKLYGLTGVVLGSLFLDIVLILYILPKSCRLLGHSLVGLIFEIRRDTVQIFKSRIRLFKNR